MLLYAAADLIEDWSTKSKPDVYHFVPYTWHLDIVLKEFELMTLTNEWNWIDCFGQTPENGKICLLPLKFHSSEFSSLPVFTYCVFVHTDVDECDLSVCGISISQMCSL